MGTRKKLRSNRKVQPSKTRKGLRNAKYVALADKGIASGADFAKLMSQLIGDIATNRVDARTANAICNAGGKLLKVVELQHKYGKPVTRKKSGGDIALLD